MSYTVQHLAAPELRNHITPKVEWEAALLQHINLASDPFTVADCISLGVRAVSDGSEWDQTQGSFRWAMSDTEGIRCATGMGPAHGSAPTSYRLEGYGMLSILCFIRRLAVYTGRTTNWHGIVATDSQSLLDTPLQLKSAIKSPLGHTTQYPTTVIKPYVLDPLLPDWDVVRGIQHLAQGMTGLQLQYVAGHQD